MVLGGASFRVGRIQTGFDEDGGRWDLIKPHGISYLVSPNFPHCSTYPNESYETMILHPFTPQDFLLRNQDAKPISAFPSESFGQYFLQMPPPLELYNNSSNST